MEELEQMTICNEFRVINIPNKDGTVNYYGTIFSSEQANRYFGLLRQNIPFLSWISIGKRIITKRKLHGKVILNTCIPIQVLHSEY